jgi:hypothetical protein
VEGYILGSGHNYVHTVKSKEKVQALRDSQIHLAFGLPGEGYGATILSAMAGIDHENLFWKAAKSDGRRGSRLPNQPIAPK